MIADTVASSNPGAMLPSDRNLPTKESQLEMDDFLKASYFTTSVPRSPRTHEGY